MFLEIFINEKLKCFTSISFHPLCYDTPNSFQVHAISFDHPWDVSATWLEPTCRQFNLLRSPERVLHLGVSKKFFSHPVHLNHLFNKQIHMHIWSNLEKITVFLQILKYMEMLSFLYSAQWDIAISFPNTGTSLSGFGIPRWRSFSTFVQQSV